jgi:hypothetical protein
MKRFLVIFLGVTTAFIACKLDKSSGTDNTDKKEVEVVITDDYALLNQSDIKPTEIASLRQQAESIMAKRIEETKKEAYTVLHKDLWFYEATVVGSKMTKMDSLGGRWLDFKEDLTYDYGSYGDNKGGGKYHYDIQTGKLMMIDNNKALKPQEFKILTVDGDILIIQGEYEYKDNNIQSKLVRRATRPAKA